MQLVSIGSVQRLAAALVVCILGFFTYVKGYDQPANFFWDENYYLPPAQKYLNGVFFMESHPPLGKLLIAAGEGLLLPNESTTHFLDTDYAKESPKGFSFSGMRLFPVLAAWLTALTFFLIALQITQSAFRSLCVSALYLFDNALIVHSRGAMLEGIQLLFISLAILCVLRVRSGVTLRAGSLLAGIFFAAALWTKENAALIAPLMLLPLFALKSNKSRGYYLGLSGLGAIATSLLVWTQAFILADGINPKLDRNGWYAASPELQAAIATNNKSPQSLYYFIRDSLTYSAQYHSRVPKLNYCKPDENGSYPLLWPLGARSINYRWQKLPDGSVQYLYLQSNPLVWFMALSAVVAALVTVGSRAIGLRNTKSTFRHEDLTIGLLASYFLYISATLMVDRVFYLYHYFIPLFLSLILLVILIEELPAIFGIKLTLYRRELLVTAIPVMAIPAFVFFKPLTYYEPLSNQEVKARSWLNVWDLFPVDGSKVNPFARPLTNNDERSRERKNWKVSISGVNALSVSQDWGTPMVGSTVDGKPMVVAGEAFSGGLGVHATSRIQFQTAARFREFSAYVGVPDDVLGKDAAVIFSVLGDGQELWRSDIYRPGNKAQYAKVQVSGVNSLMLEVISAKDGIDFNHACWLEPSLIK